MTGTNNPQIQRARALQQLAAEQSGYFTTDQALHLGYSYPDQVYHRKRGNWLPAGPRIYRLPHHPAGENEDLVRLALWSRDRTGRINAVASHDTALRVHDLSDLAPPRVHLTVPRKFRKTPPSGVILHHTDLPDSDVEEHAGYRVTTPLRTIIDAATSDLSPEHVHQAVRDALERGLIRAKTLRERASTLPEAAATLLARAMASA